jgi:hypothetical protein
MNLARLIFYAVTSLFLGSIALAIGGAQALQAVFAPVPGSPFVPGSTYLAPSGEPFRTLIAAVTIAAPILFLGVAVVEIIRPERLR